MRKIIILSLFSLIFLSGCYDSNEPNDIAYVVALGVDSSKDIEGEYEFTVQFAKTTQISGGASEEGGKEGSNILENITVKAPTIYSGINIANQVVSKRFTLAHTKLIVFSDEIAKKGVRDILDSFGRNSDIRPNIYVAVSNGKAQEYLKAVKPVVEVNPVNYYQLIFESKYGAYVPRMLLKDFYFQLESNDNENILPLAGVNEKNKKEESEEGSSGGESGGESQGGGESKGQGEGQGGSQEGEGEQNSNAGKEQENEAKPNKNGFDFLMKEYEAGNIDVQKKNASEVMGMAIFKDDKMIATTDGEDSLIYNMLKDNFKISYVTFYDADTPTMPITLSLEQRKAPAIKVKTDQNPKIKVNVFLEGQLISESANSPVEVDIKKTEKIVEDSTKKVISAFLEKTKKEYNSDIIGFGKWAKINFLTYDDFEKYKWTEKYNSVEFEVEVDFKLRRIGFIDLRNEDEIRNAVGGGK